MDLCIIIKKIGQMTNSTTENFLQVMATFKWPDEQAVSYRLYYNQDGTPKCYTMEQLSGKYVEVDAETFALRPWNVRVVNEKLQIITPAVTVQKLTPNKHTGATCHTQDVCVIVPSDCDHNKWNITTNETY